MKRRILGSLWLVILGLRSLSADPASLPTPPENAYGIELEKCYPGSLMQEILRAAEEEASQAVEEAYAEGYKEGRIDGAALWAEEYRKLQREYEQVSRQLSQRIGWFTVISIGVGALGVGVLAGMVVR